MQSPRSPKAILEAKTWNFHGNFWHCDVNGDWGYNQSNFGAGVGCDYDENWNWALEYNKVDGDFDDRPNLDYTVEDIMLKLSYRW